MGRVDRVDLGAGLLRYLSSALMGAVLAPFAASAIALEPGRPAGHGSLVSHRKGADAHMDDVGPAAPVQTLGTLVSLHHNEILVMSEKEPSEEAFSRLLRDRVTDESADISPRLLDLLRELANDGKPVRVEFISGYRSWKLNEVLRKKGRNVSSNSQHCLGHAMDFRIEGMSAEQLARAVEASRWRGGLAHYPGDADRFVHTDVGPNRRWRGR